LTSVSASASTCVGASTTPADPSPCPSCPRLLAPHVYRWPSHVSPAAWLSLIATAAQRPTAWIACGAETDWGAAEMPSWPRALSPVAVGGRGGRGGWYERGGKRGAGLAVFAYGQSIDRLVPASFRSRHPRPMQCCFSLCRLATPIACLLASTSAPPWALGTGHTSEAKATACAYAYACAAFAVLLLLLLPLLRQARQSANSSPQTQALFCTVVDRSGLLGETAYSCSSIERCA